MPIENRYDFKPHLPSSVEEGWPHRAGVKAARSAVPVAVYSEQIIYTVSIPYSHTGSGNQSRATGHLRAGLTGAKK